MRPCNSRFALLLFSLLNVIAAQAQEPQPQAATPALSPATAVSSDLVFLPVSVTGPDARPIISLGKQNFTLLEDNRPQTILSFSAEDAPASIGILLDLSGSMQLKLPAARAAILEFGRNSNPHDEFFIVGFSRRPALLADFTSSADDLKARLANVETGHSTALYDALCFAFEKMNASRYHRRALLIVSDGADNASTHTEHDADTAARKAQLPIYSIIVTHPDAATIEERNGPIFLNGLSNSTGGQSFQDGDPSQMQAAAATVSIALRAQYVLGYKTDNVRMDGRWRKVKVKLSPPPGLPQLTVHARAGYYAPLQ
jgi:Ca-activated chloride channel family protein